MQIIVVLHKNNTPQNPLLLKTMQERTGTQSIQFVRTIGPSMHVYSVQYKGDCAEQIVNRLQELPEIKSVDVDRMMRAF